MQRNSWETPEKGTLSKGIPEKGIPEKGIPEKGTPGKELQGNDLQRKELQRKKTLKGKEGNKQIDLTKISFCFTEFTGQLKYSQFLSSKPDNPTKSKWHIMKICYPLCHLQCNHARLRLVFVVSLRFNFLPLAV